VNNPKPGVKKKGKGQKRDSRGRSIHRVEQGRVEKKVPKRLKETLIEMEATIQAPAEDLEHGGARLEIHKTDWEKKKG